MRSDARKKLNDGWRVQQEAEAGLVEAAYLRGEVDALGRPVTPSAPVARLADIRALAHQLLEDADTQHPDPFLCGCATGTTDTAQAILNTLGDAL